MQKTGKILLVLLCMTLIAVALAFSVSAADAPTSEVIVVGETVNPKTQEAYTLSEAWAYAEASESDVEVVVNADSSNYTDQVKAINKANKKTTLQLSGEITTTTTFSITSGADITIDVSDATLTIAHRITNDQNAKLTFRTSTAAGTVTGGKDAIVYVVPSATSNPEVAFLSSKTEGCALTVNATTPIILFGTNSTSGTAKFTMDGGIYTTDDEIFRLNSNATSKPCVFQLDASDASFILTSYGMLRHNLPNSFTTNGGAFGLGTYASFKNCDFSSTNTSERNFFRVASDSNFNGRFFGKVTFDTCSFNKVTVNGDAIMTHVKQTGTDEGGNPVYDSNYPYLAPGETATKQNNCTYDYRPEAVADGWTTEGQITFKGECTFTSANKTFNDAIDGFRYENMVGEGDAYNVFYLSSTEVMTKNAIINSIDDFNYFFDLNKTAKRHNVLQLAADLELTSAFKINKTQSLALDLNGYTLSVSTSGASNVYGTLHIFSSKEGGEFIASCSSGFVLLNNDSSGATPTITFGREEDPKENLSVSSPLTKSGSGLILFSNSFAYDKATLSFYNVTLSSNYYLIKLNSNATKDIAPKVEITMKGCDITVGTKGLLCYNENKLYDTDESTNNGRIAAGSFLDVEGCTINGDGGNLFETIYYPRTEGGTAIPNFQGRYYGTVTFKSTAFNNVKLNCGYLYSTKDNLAHNGVNEKYAVPDDWDVTKQVTFLPGCTFLKTSGLLNKDESGVLEGLSNVTVAEGTVIAYTEVADQRALLLKDDTVELTWALPDADAYTILYKKNAEILAPELPEGTTVNGNTYSLAWNPTPELATESTTFTTKWTGGATLSANYSLNTAIDFNAYVPVSGEITHVNGTPVAELAKKSLNAKQFWMVTFADLAPKDAYKSQCVALTVQMDEQTSVVVERYISLVGYAKSALKSEANDTLKSLVLHTLDYINKAHLYFEENAESVEQIDELLTTYEFEAYTWEENNIKDIAGTYENVLGAGLDLSQMPGFAIYVRADYEGDVIVNGKSYNDYIDVPVEEGEHAKCVIIEMKAYNMTSDLVVVVGNDTFEFNLDTFIKYNAASEPYAHALYGYAVAAEKYLKTQK